VTHDPHPDSERDLVDQIALVLEHGGLTPVAGRIMGRLLMCDPPHQSSTQLAEYVHASGGAVSMATRTRITVGLVERIRVRGQRSHFFRIKPDCWSALIHAEMLRLKRLREIADQGLALLASRDTGSDPQRMTDFRDFNAFFEKEFPILVKHWDNRKEGES
jgi:DNA-binding transcriptional regulator GbsR (MarR family)